MGKYSALILLVLFTLSCDESNTNTNDASDMQAEEALVPDSGPVDSNLPDANDEEETDAETAVPEGWTTVEPGGETGCSDGSPYRFFVHGGDPARLAIFMQGGGACWNLLTCAMGSSMSRPDVPDDEEFLASLEDKTSHGVLDLENPSNPYKGWTLLYLPYCSSDIHWGRQIKEYSPQLKISHLGFFNASSGLDWIYARISNPTDVIVSGSSAGGYGALLHSAYVAQQYPNARMRVIVDAAAGITAGTFQADSMEAWKAADSIPEFIPSLAETDPSTLTFNQLYVAIAQHLPDARFALYSTAWDDQQTFFYKVMGGKVEDWPPALQQQVQSLSDQLLNFTFFIPAGTLHTILPFEALYERSSDGIFITDWLRDFIIDENMPEPVNCTAEGCQIDPICEACPPEEQEGRPFHCYVCESMSALIQ